MANISETASYDAGVYQIATSDPVSGGATGVANKPLSNLANRTAYLKQHLDSLESGATIPGTVAPIDSPVFTGSPKTTTPAAGDSSTRISDTEFATRLKYGVISINVGGNADVTLTAAQYGLGVIVFTGALTGSINVIFPNTGSWILVNRTTGSYNVTAKTALGTGIVVPASNADIVCGDGTNIIAASSAGQTSLRRETISPAAGTTTLTVTGGYVPGNVILSRNGSLLDSGTDYLDNTSPDIALQTASTAGDVYEVYAFASFAVANAVQRSGDTMQGPLNLALAAQFDNSNKGATTSFVQRALGNLQSIASYSASTSIPASLAGSFVMATGSAALTFTLPAASGLGAGAAYHFFNESSAALTINGAGSDTVRLARSASGGSVSIPAGASVSVIKSGAASWACFGAGAVAFASSAESRAGNALNVAVNPAGMAAYVGQSGLGKSASQALPASGTVSLDDYYIDGHFRFQEATYTAAGGTQNLDAFKDGQLAVFNASGQDTTLQIISGYGNGAVMWRSFVNANGASPNAASHPFKSVWDSGNFNPANYLGIGAQAADSAKLNGQAASYYALASALANYLGVNAQAADSAKLNGQSASYYALASQLANYLGINAKAADSNKLNGQVASYYATVSQLGGYANTGLSNVSDGTVVGKLSGMSGYDIGCLMMVYYYVGSSNNNVNVNQNVSNVYGWADTTVSIPGTWRALEFSSGYQQYIQFLAVRIA